MDWVGLIAVLVCIALATQRWFWLLAFGAGGVWSLFSMIASIIWFQIPMAMAWFVAVGACGLAVAKIHLGGIEERRNAEQRRINDARRQRGLSGSLDP